MTDQSDTLDFVASVVWTIEELFGEMKSVTLKCGHQWNYEYVEPTDLVYCALCDDYKSPKPKPTPKISEKKPPLPPKKPRKKPATPAKKDPISGWFVNSDADLPPLEKSTRVSTNRGYAAHMGKDEKIAALKRVYELTDQGYKAVQIAEHVGVSQATISAWLRARKA